MKRKKFIISRRQATTRISSTLQHKLRVVMKCYTVKNFIINEEDNTFTFNKTNRVRGIVISDKKNYSGSYETSKLEVQDPLEDEKFELTIYVN